MTKARDNAYLDGLDLIYSATVGNAVSTVTVDNVFSATYDRYKISWSGGLGSQGGSDVYLRLGSATTGYKWNFVYSSYGSTAYQALVASNGSSFNYAGATSTTFGYLECELTAPFLARKTLFQRLFVGETNSGIHNGFLDNTNSYTGFSLIVGDGTITGGTIQVFGYRK